MFPYIKFTYNLFSSKVTFREGKWQVMNKWNHIYISKIHKSHKSIRSEQTTQYKKWSRDINK